MEKSVEKTQFEVGPWQLLLPFSKHGLTVDIYRESIAGAEIVESIRDFDQSHAYANPGEKVIIQDKNTEEYYLEGTVAYLEKCALADLSQERIDNLLVSKCAMAAFGDMPKTPEEIAHLLGVAFERTVTVGDAILIYGIRVAKEN